MALDEALARRLLEFFAKCPPPWISEYRLPPRAPLALAFAALTGAGFSYADIADALHYAGSTPKTYIRDVAEDCVDASYRTRKKGLELLAHAHLASANPELLADLIRTDVLRPTYRRAS